MDDFVEQYNLSDTFVYLDNITISGKTQKEHDKSLAAFMSAAKEYGLTLRDDKCHYSLKAIDLLGYHITHGNLNPDLDRLRPLLDLPVPFNLKSLRRIIGMFAYYAKWLSNFSEKVRPLNTANIFPLNEEAVNAFNILKQDLI